MRSTILFLLLAISAFAQQQPNVAAQREATKKVEFLVGKWEGGASVWRGAAEPMKIRQTEEIEYRLGGLLLQGTGRTADGKIGFQALATISYDEQTSTYRFRTHSDGRYLDTELRVTPSGFSWGFDAGPAKIMNTMRLTEKGEWAETTEAQFATGPPQKSVEMLLHRLP